MLKNKILSKAQLKHRPFEEEENDYPIQLIATSRPALNWALKKHVMQLAPNAINLCTQSDLWSNALHWDTFHYRSTSIYSAINHLAKDQCFPTTASPSESATDNYSSALQIYTWFTIRILYRPYHVYWWN